MISAAVLFVPRSEATVATMQLVPGATSAVEQVARTCIRQRKCLPGKGCAWRTVCKRTPTKAHPKRLGPTTPGETAPGKM
jgi:hypothetical protein